MSTTKLRCRCKPDYKCSAPLHGEIEIITCEKNYGLGCDGIFSQKEKKQGNCLAHWVNFYSNSL